MFGKPAPTYTSDVARRSALLTATLLAGLAAAPDRQAHAAMLIEHIPVNMWRGQRDVRLTDDPEEQKALRADVALYVKSRFRVIGERLFIISPDEGIRLMAGPFLLIGPGHFQSIDSAPVYEQRPFVRHLKNALHPDQPVETVITLGVTLSGKKIYTAITLHTIPNSKDELIGYFKFEPLVPDPVEGLG